MSRYETSTERGGGRRASLLVRGKRSHARRQTPAKESGKPRRNKFNMQGYIGGKYAPYACFWLLFSREKSNPGYGAGSPKRSRPGRRSPRLYCSAARRGFIKGKGSKIPLQHGLDIPLRRLGKPPLVLGGQGEAVEPLGVPVEHMPHRRQGPRGSEAHRSRRRSPGSGPRLPGDPAPAPVGPPCRRRRTAPPGAQKPMRLMSFSSKAAFTRACGRCKVSKAYRALSSRERISPLSASS